MPSSCHLVILLAALGENQLTKLFEAFIDLGIKMVHPGIQ